MVEWDRFRAGWKKLHDAVTRNHRFSTMRQLLIAVRDFLQIDKKRFSHRVDRASPGPREKVAR